MKIYKVISLIFAGCLSACTNTSVMKRKPSSTPEIIELKELSGTSPIAFLDHLRASCCGNPVMINPGKLDFWNESDIEELKKYVSDTTPVSPVASVYSSHSCAGDKFVSTLGREAQHLIKAIQAGRYPLGLCSTYDLKL